MTMKIEWTMVTSGECSKLEDVPKGAQIAAVNDIECLGRCEACGVPILDGDDYHCDEDGVFVCVKCCQE
jgi:hypothetical protein